MTPLAFGLGAQELLLILLIVVVLFGAKKIPEIMRGLGQGVSSFKKGVRGDEDEGENDGDSKGSSPP